MKKLLSTLLCTMLIIAFTTCCGIMHKFVDVRAEQTFDLTAKSALLIDYDSNTIIFEKDKNKKLPIASMVKLMTIYITLDSINRGELVLDQKVTTSENASGMGGSQVFIDPYEEYTVGDLLKSVIMASANDASVALAEAISGSESVFVDLMNSTAKQIGMTNTLYCNSTGLPAPEQYSTAEDCAILLKKLISFDQYHKFSNIWMDELCHPSGRKTELVNTNKMIRYYDGCDSGKTGSTSEAGYCLSASALRNNMRLISVIIGAKSGNDRFKESTLLLNYGFANYQNKQIINKEVVLKEIDAKRCKEKTAQIVATEDFFAFDKKGASSSYKVDYELPEYLLKAKAGDVVGRVIISKDGNIVKIINLTVKTSLTALGFVDNFKMITENW
ncbi:MAG: D-alanyl-D-alanine carboxypeptidase [Clostridia bacterium]|nr:D-alanyl-D-alanine carboxypeptidase [Clostridia bacterium]